MTGTYAKLHFDSASAKSIIDFCQLHGIPNVVPKNKLHVTLLYSRKHLPNYEPRIHCDIVAAPSHFVVWDSNPDQAQKTRCLVLKLESHALVQRHLELMAEHGATFDYQVYQPHVTLSYDIGDLDIEGLPVAFPPLRLVGERKSDLDLTWTPTKSNA